MPTSFYQKRVQVATLFQTGKYTVSQISRILKVSRPFVDKWKDATNRFEDAPRSGRPATVSKEIDRAIKRRVQRKRFRSLRKTVLWLRSSLSRDP